MTEPLARRLEIVELAEADRAHGITEGSNFI